MFRKNAHLTDNAEIEEKYRLAEFIRKGVPRANRNREYANANPHYTRSKSTARCGVGE